jgi:predicted heme/steroid binding protein
MKQAKLSKEERQKYVETYKMIEDFIPIYHRAKIESKNDTPFEYLIYLLDKKEIRDVSYSLNRRNAKLYSSLRKDLKETFKDNKVIMDILDLFPPAWALRKKIFDPLFLTLAFAANLLTYKYMPPSWNFEIIFMVNLIVWGLIFYHLGRFLKNNSLHLSEDMKRVQREIEEILKEDENETDSSCNANKHTY